jgi:Permuted papain-like amidase enzyme, YaeF/YiiX, C92 family
MWTLFVACVLAGGPDAPATVPATAADATAKIESKLETGSLIFSRGDCLAVKIFSQSSYTHVGGVVVKDGRAVVYDSMNGVGVRKTPLDEYLRLQTPSTIHIVHPAKPFTGEQVTAYESHLEAQLGRKYAIRHHLTGKRCDGLHCSEYMTDALMSAQLIRANEPPRVSPGSLLEGLERAKLCTDGGKFTLKTPPMPAPANLTWCQRAWKSTVNCCSNCCSQMRRWVLCR